MRTFLLLSLLGAAAGGLAQPFLAGALAFFSLALIVMSYARSTERGLTTEFAAGLVFCLGYLTHKQPVLAAVMGPVVALVLISKRSLHRWTHEMKTSELQAAVLLFLLAATVRHVIPDRTVDPWDLLNPRQFGYIVLILAVMEFTSYVLVKTVGARKGALVTGFLGGLVSSTAVTLSMARNSVRSRDGRLELSSVVAATLAAFIELLVLVALISMPLAVALAPAIGVTVAGGTMLIMLWRAGGRSHDGLALKSPLDLRGVLRLALLLVVVLTAVALVERNFGSVGTLFMSFITGLFELHGLSVATSTLFKQERIELSPAYWSLILAAGASMVSKVAIACMVGSRSFAVRLTAAMATLAAALSFAALLFA